MQRTAAFQRLGHKSPDNRLLEICALNSEQKWMVRRMKFVLFLFQIPISIHRLVSGRSCLYIHTCVYMQYLYATETGFLYHTPTTNLPRVLW